MSTHLKRNTPVIVRGKAAIVVFPTLNKVKVRFEDGTEQMVSHQQINCKTKNQENGTRKH